MVQIEFDIGGEQFKLKGNIEKDPGFLEVMPWMRTTDKEIPLYKKG